MKTSLDTFMNELLSKALTSKKINIFHEQHEKMIPYSSKRKRDTYTRETNGCCKSNERDDQTLRAYLATLFSQ